jgi:hypothetical protein
VGFVVNKMALGQGFLRAHLSLAFGGLIIHGFFPKIKFKKYQNFPEYCRRF